MLGVLTAGDLTRLMEPSGRAVGPVERVMSRTPARARRPAGQRGGLSHGAARHHGDARARGRPSSSSASCISTTCFAQGSHETSACSAPCAPPLARRRKRGQRASREAHASHRRQRRAGTVPRALAAHRPRRATRRAVRGLAYVFDENTLRAAESARDLQHGHGVKDGAMSADRGRYNLQPAGSRGFRQRRHHHERPESSCVTTPQVHSGTERSIERHVVHVVGRGETSGSRIPAGSQLKHVHRAEAAAKGQGRFDLPKSLMRSLISRSPG